MRNSTTDFKVDAETIRFCAEQVLDLRNEYSRIWIENPYRHYTEQLTKELEPIKMRIRTWKRMLQTCLEIYKNESTDMVAETKGNNEGEREGLMMLRILGATDMVEQDRVFECKMPMGYTALLVKGDYNFVELEPPHGVDYFNYVNHGKYDCPNARYEDLLNLVILGE